MSFDSIRELERSETFIKGIRRLSKKYPSVEDDAENFLRQVCSSGPVQTSKRIPGTGGSVFKERLGLGNRGRRSGARVIYYCDDSRVLALFVYAKNDKDDVPVPEILEALDDFDLLPPN